MEFPLGFAQVQRQLLMAKALQIEGYEVTVLCRYGIHNQTAGVDPDGIFEGVHYIYCSGSTVRPSGFMKRNILKIKGLIQEVRYYQKYSKEGNLAGALVSTNNFYNIFFYFLLGKLFGVVTVVDNVEYWTSNKNFRGFDRFDKYLYDKFYFYFSDNIICISDYLIRKISLSKRKKTTKIPAITDFSKFRNIDSTKTLDGHRYFLYCGSEHYFEVIDFVISSYEEFGESDIYLALVTKNTRILSERLRKSVMKNQIRIFQNLPYNELVNLYGCSEALIIPLRNIDQDKARFPHKISEYCASSRPIVTNSVGEMCNYFDSTNSFLCENYDQKEYAEILRKLLSEPELAKQKSIRSYELGLKYFSYSSYSKSLALMFTKK